MALPVAIAEALRDVDPETFPGSLAVEGTECEGAKFHSPGPLVLFEVATPERTVRLCGTCRANYFVLRALLAHHGGELPWPVRREFGNRLRALLIPKESDA